MNTVTTEEASKDYWQSISLAELKLKKRKYDDILLEGFDRLEPDKAILLPLSPSSSRRSGKFNGARWALRGLKEKQKIPDDVHLLENKGKAYLYRGEKL